MTGKSYPGTEVCVYCMRPFAPHELTDEHIIPEALGGALIFKKAACICCARHSNQAYENIALQADFLVPRLLLELKRKRQNQKTPKKLPLASSQCFSPENSAHVVYDLELEVAQYPQVFDWIVIEPPGKLVGIERGEGLKGMWIQHIDLGIRSTLSYPVSTRHMHNHTAFGLTVVKIGYCFAMAERGFDKFDGSEVRDLLSGKRNDLYNFFGSSSDGSSIRLDQLHHISLIEEKGFLIARVQLFASCAALPYLVVLGPILPLKIPT